MSSLSAQILLVEDDPNDLELTMRVLRADHSYLRVEVARDGEEALDYLLRRGEWKERPLGEEPNLVLLDLKLPKIGGLQVLEELRSRSACPAVPVVVLSSSGEHRDILESYRLGANSYVQKPVEISEFRVSIRAIANYWLNISRLPSPALGHVRARIEPDSQEGVR